MPGMRFSECVYVALFAAIAHSEKRMQCVHLLQNALIVDL